MDPSNPDDLALLLIQQYFSERPNFRKALEETERATYLNYVESKLPRGSMLLEMVYKKLEEDAAQVVDTERLELQAEEEALLQGGSSDFLTHCVRQIQGLHAAPIVAIAGCPGGAQAITGTGDGSVQCIELEDGEELWRARVGGGGAISLAIHPQYRAGVRLVLVGSMDGSVSLLDAASGAVLHTERANQKYVVRVRWAPHGDLFVSASRDGTIAAYELIRQGSSDVASAMASRLSFGKKASVPFSTTPLDIEFAANGSLVVIALRDTSHLRLRKFPEIQEEVGRVNLNAQPGDDHVSFSATQLQLSPCGKYLLVSTDSPRILVMRVQGWQQAPLFTMFGLSRDNFHCENALWHKSGFYIMAAAAAGHIYVFHIGSGKVVSTFKAHEQNVRGMSYDADKNQLLTCSFDRTVCIFQG